MAGIETVDEYIGSFPSEIRDRLDELRRAILETVPEAGERISYKMPTITLEDRYLIYFAAWKNHIALYPIPRFEEPLESELEMYRAAKDALHFPHAKPLPLDLVPKVVSALVARRAGENG